MSLFVNPMQMGPSHLFLVIPLCLGVAIVYKTIRVQDLRRLPLAILALWLYILAGVGTLMVAFHLLLEYVP